LAAFVKGKAAVNMKQLPKNSNRITRKEQATLTGGAIGPQLVPYCLISQGGQPLYLIRNCSCGTHPLTITLLPGQTCTNKLINESEGSMPYTNPDAA
jgi:hypothetical protein